MMPRFITKAERHGLIDKVVDLRAEGLSVPVIARRLGISQGSASNYLWTNHASLYMRQRGLVFLRGTSHIVSRFPTQAEIIAARCRLDRNASDVQRVFDLYDGCFSTYQVADITGFPHGTIRQWLRDSGRIRSHAEANRARYNSVVGKSGDRLRKIERAARLRLQGLTYLNIAGQIGTCEATVCHYMKTPLAQQILRQ